MRAAVDWALLKAEYIAGGTSLAKMAEQYSIPIATLKRHAIKDKWAAEKSHADLDVIVSTANAENLPFVDAVIPEPDPQIDAEIVGRIMDKRIDRAARFIRMTDEMAERIEDALATVDVNNPYAIKMLASALKDLREMQGLNRTQLDIEEQRARITALRARFPEQDNSPRGVLVLPAVNGALVPPEDADG